MIKIIINAIPPSNNHFLGNSHNFNEYRRTKQDWHWLIKTAIKRKPSKPFERAIVTIKYFFPDRKRRDPDNYSGKMILDPLVREGILKDDSFKCITLKLEADCCKENPRTEIIIQDGWFGDDIKCND